MKKNIKMNKEQMETSKYRAVIPYGEDEIVIKNMDRELRNKVVEMVANSVEKNEELDNVELMNLLVDELTNVEFEVPITEIEQPSHHVALIFYHINEILTELTEEILVAGKIVANSQKAEISNQKAKEKLMEEAKKVQEELEKEETVVEIKAKREVKKPSRSRGRMNRK